MSETNTEQNSMVVTRLSVMMFIQFFVWGAWFVTLGACLGTFGFSPKSIGDAYNSAPIAAIISPLFLGLFADRFFASERMMGILMLIGGAMMCAVPSLIESGNTDAANWLFLLHMICYMPTLGLSNTIAFSNIPSQEQFPQIRVWGTIGWIVAGLVTGFMGWSLKLNIFWLAGISSIVFGLYSFTLPHTPPPARGKEVDFRSLFMLDAFQLLTNFPFAVFILCSTLICIPLAYYYGVTSIYLTDVGFEQPASSMSLGQMSEIIFMILIPFFLRHLGVKMMILVGMLAWVLRYLLFAIGAPDQIAWMLFLAIILHGICYDFFFVTGFIYTDKKVLREVRGQAQSMLVFFTQGVGMYFGYIVAFSQMEKTVPKHGDLAQAITDARPEESLTYLESMSKMFSINLPAVDETILSETMQQWQSFWWLPALMAGGIALLFFVAFWDSLQDNKVETEIELANDQQTEDEGIDA